MTTATKPLALLLSLLFWAVADVQAQPPISWSAPSVNVELGSGQTVAPSSVTFVSSRPLADVHAIVVPELSGFLAAAPEFFAEVAPGVEYEVHLEWSIPPEATEGMKTGTLRLTAGTQTIPRPLPIEVTIDFADNRLNEHTKVLPASSASLLTEVSLDEFRFTFGQTDTYINALTVGDIVAIPPAPLVPDGFLLRVLSVSSDEDGVTISGAPAALTEVFESANIEFQFSVTEEDIESIETPEPTDNALPPLPTDLIQFQHSLAAVLFDQDGSPATTDDQVRSTGMIAGSADISFSLTILNGTLVDLETLLDAHAEIDSLVQSDVDIALPQIRFPLVKLRFRPVCGLFTPVLVCARPVLLLTVGASGNVSHLTAGLSSTLDYELGARFDGTSWEPTTVFSSSLTFDDPVLAGATNLVADVGPALQLLFFGAVGPEISPRAFRRLDADTNRCPNWWKYYGGFRADLRVEMGPFSPFVPSLEWPGLISTERPLASALDCRCDLNGLWYHNCDGTQDITQVGDQLFILDQEPGFQWTGHGTFVGATIEASYSNPQDPCTFNTTATFQGTCDSASGTWHWTSGPPPCTDRSNHPWAIDRTSPPGEPCL